jgi:hypothetical protein
VLEMPIREELLQQNGFVHGGVVSSLADTALAFAGGSALGRPGGSPRPASPTPRRAGSRSPRWRAPSSSPGPFAAPSPSRPPARAPARPSGRRCPGSGGTLPGGANKIGRSV